MDVRRDWCERVMIPTVTFSAYTFSLRINARNKLNAREMKCSGSLCGLTRMDRWRNGGVMHRVCVRGKVSDRVDRNVLEAFGQADRMKGDRLTGKRTSLLCKEKGIEACLV